jgi:hypothetical protein
MTAIDAPPSAPKLDAPKQQQQPQDGSTKACNEVYDILRSLHSAGISQTSELKGFGNLQIDDSSAAAKVDKDALTKFAAKEQFSEMKLSSHPRHERAAVHAKTGAAEQAAEKREAAQKREAKEKGQKGHPGDQQSKQQDQNMFGKMLTGIEHASTEAQINLLKTAVTTFINEYQKADKQDSDEADSSFKKGLNQCLKPVYDSIAMIDATLHGEGGKVLPIFLQDREKQIDQLKKELDQVMKRGVINTGADTIIGIVKNIQEIFTEPGNKLADPAAGILAPTAFDIAGSGIKSNITAQLPDWIKDPYEAVNKGREQVEKPSEWNKTLGELAHGEGKEHKTARRRAGNHELKFSMSTEIASSDVHDMLDGFEVFNDTSDLKKRAV